MNKLLSSTALVLALGVPVMALAQTAPPAANSTMRAQIANTPGFLHQRALSDVMASELMGHDVHARRITVDRTATGAASTNGTRGDADVRLLNRADLDNMDAIGQLNELVLSHDGQVRAIVIGVGGFLGMGERNVAVTWDQVTIAFDRDDRSIMYVVANIDADTLDAAPRYDRSVQASQASASQERLLATDRTSATGSNGFTPPDVNRDGYTRVEVLSVSADTLMGTTVHDMSDASVGTVQDLIVDDAGAITDVIIDFGGFLGMGSSQVSLAFSELTILSNDTDSSLRIYVDATKEQIQNLPQYQATN